MSTVVLLTDQGAGRGALPISGSLDGSGNASVGPMIFIPSGTGEFERQLQIKGVVGTASALDGAEFNDAIAAISSTNKGRNSKLPPGAAFNIDAPLSMDVSKFGLDLNRGSLNFKDLAASTNAINFTNTSNLSLSTEGGWSPLHNGSILRRDVSNVSMRDDSYNKDVKGLSFDSASANYPLAALLIRDLYVEGFRDAVNLGRNCYIMAFHNVHMMRNYTAVASRNYGIGNFANQGERQSFVQCVVANNYEHIYNEAEYFWFSNSSLDYPSVPTANITDIANRRQRMATIRVGGKLHLNQCHMEFRDNSPMSNDTALIYVQKANSSFQATGGALVCGLAKWDNSALANGAGGYPTYTNLQHFIEVGGTGVGEVSWTGAQRWATSAFASRKLMRLAPVSADMPTSGAPNKVDWSGNDDPATGMGGKSIIPCLGDASVAGGRGFGSLLRPTFDALVNEDYWYICGSGGGALTGQSNSRFAATGFNLSVASNILTVTKTVAGGNYRMRLMAPVQQGKKLALSFRASASSAASIPINIAFVTQTGQITNGLPATNTVKTCSSASSMAVATGDTDFDLHSFAAQSGATWDQGDRDVPKYAQFVQIQFSLDAVDGSVTPFALNLKNFSLDWV